jgi:hypothetical protein
MKTVRKAAVGRIRLGTLAVGKVADKKPVPRVML